jgi:hypothetical protein
MRSHLVLDFESVPGKILWVHGEQTFLEGGKVTANTFFEDAFLAYEPEIISEIGLDRVPNLKKNKDFLKRYNSLLKSADKVIKYNSIHNIKDSLKKMSVTDQAEIIHMSNILEEPNLKPSISCLFLV